MIHMLRLFSQCVPERLFLCLFHDLFNVGFDSGGGGICISRLYRLILFEGRGEKAFKKKDMHVLLSKGCDPVIM